VPPERFTGFPACKRGLATRQVARTQACGDGSMSRPLVTFVECALRLVELARKFPPLSGPRGAKRSRLRRFPGEISSSPTKTDEFAN
jgi:hypothetical protein